MEKVAFIIDSSGSIGDELRVREDVFELQMTIALEDGTLLEDTTDELKLSEFYTKLVESDEIPTTSQPSPYAYTSTLDQVIEEGYTTVIFILVSSRFSGTYQTAVAIAQDYQETLNIYIVDSKGTSFMMESLLIQGLKLLGEGLEATSIFNQLEEISSQSTAYFVVEDLNFFVKGGRLNALTAFIGTKLKIIPMIHFTREGEVKLLEMNRTLKRAYKRMVEIALTEANNFNEMDIIIAHADTKEKALELYGLLKEELPNVHYRIGYLTPTLGTHGGKGAHGIGIIPRII